MMGMCNANAHAHDNAHAHANALAHGSVRYACAVLNWITKDLEALTNGAFRRSLITSYKSEIKKL